MAQAPRYQQHHQRQQHRRHDGQVPHIDAVRGDTVTGHGVLDKEAGTNAPAGTVVAEIEREPGAPVTAKPSAAMCTTSVIVAERIVTVIVTTAGTATAEANTGRDAGAGPRASEPGVRSTRPESPAMAIVTMTGTVRVSVTASASRRAPGGDRNPLRRCPRGRTGS